MPKPLLNNSLITAIIFIIQLISFYSFSQEIVQKSPIGLNSDVYNKIPAVIVNAYASSGIIKKKGGKVQESPIGYNRKVDLSPLQCGKWTRHSSNVNTWHLKIKSPGASGMGLVFTNVILLDNEKLYIYNLNGPIHTLDRSSIPPSGILPLNYFKGNELVIEYVVPSENRKTGSFTIETISNIFSDPSKRIQDDCNIDINCISGDSWDTDKRAVLKMLIYEDSVTRFCTCSLVNNTANDRKPYILTAQHCIANQAEADRSIFIFDYETTECNGPYDSEERQLTGAKLLASSYTHDFSLLELYVAPPLSFRPYYSGWDISDAYLTDVTCIHHPWGTPKKITRSYGRISANNFDDGTARAPQGFWNVKKWNKGITENGSSGAPLFNINHLLIGTLTGGSAECGSPFNDYFSRLSQSWEASPAPFGQLKYWLDPSNSGLQKLEGMDPFPGVTAVCDTISNIQAEENIKLIPYTDGAGYYSGVNTDSIRSYAERFFNQDSLILSGVILNPGSINPIADGGLIVSIKEDDHGKPGKSLTEAYVSYGSLNIDSSRFIELFPPVNISHDYFVSYTVNYSKGDRFALKQSEWKDVKNNSAYIKLSSGWAPISQLSGHGSSFDIKVVRCTNQVPNLVYQYLKVYPNPAFYSAVTLELPFDPDESFSINIYDLQGKHHPPKYKVTDHKAELNIDGLSPGMYIIRISVAGKHYACKFIKA